ncbi:MAG: flagellar hook-basal body protein [Chloroflexota bacterium]
MWTSLRIASLGVQAQQRVIDVSSNNIAHANTLGFKKQRAELADVAPTNTAFGLGTEPGPLVLGQAADGGGAVMSSVLTSFQLGLATPTEQPLDVMINGVGFIPVTTKSGVPAFTRNGAFRLDANRRLSTSDGSVITPAINVPATAKSLGIGPDGSITAILTGDIPEAIGQLQLTRFSNPDGLARIGGELFVATEASGGTITGAPGQNGLGSLLPGTLEASNVDISEELLRVIQAQRAYQMNLRSLKSADEMLQTASNLQR